MAARSVRTMQQIGRVVTEHRKAAGLSRADLADLAGVGKTALFDLEHGKATVRFETLRRVLDALNISINLDSPLMAQLDERSDA